MAEIKINLQEVIEKSCLSQLGITRERLLEICNAERDGRCVVLPCKVGDNVYSLSGTRLFVTNITLFHEGGVVVTAAADRENVIWTGKHFEPSEFGKTVFLTRADAEAAPVKEGTPSDWTKNKACRDAVLKTFGGES